MQTYTKDSLSALGELKVNEFVDDYCIPDLKILVIKEESTSLIVLT